MPNQSRILQKTTEIAAAASKGDPLSYLDCGRIAKKQAEDIALLPPKERIPIINELLASYAGDGKLGVGTSGMTLTRLQVIGMLDTLTRITDINDVMPFGFRVKYGSGSWGSSGVDVNHPAFSERAALQFIRFLISTYQDKEELLQLVPLGRVSYVEFDYIPPGEIQ